jgi:hypothetical protein
MCLCWRVQSYIVFLPFPRCPHRSSCRCVAGHLTEHNLLITLVLLRTWPSTSRSSCCAMSSFYDPPKGFHSPQVLPRHPPADHVNHLPYKPSPPSKSLVGHKLQIYPLSTVALVIWVAYVAATIWLCERTATLSKTTVGLPWAYTTLPSLLLTGFAQGHSAITAMHLGRLAVSALHQRLTRPRSWAELFWLADSK